MYCRCITQGSPSPCLTHARPHALEECNRDRIVYASCTRGAPYMRLFLYAYPRTQPTNLYTYTVQQNSSTAVQKQTHCTQSTYYEGRSSPPPDHTKPHQTTAPYQSENAQTKRHKHIHATNRIASGHLSGSPVASHFPHAPFPCPGVRASCEDRVFLCWGGWCGGMYPSACLVSIIMSTSARHDCCCCCGIYKGGSEHVFTGNSGE